MKRFLLCFAVFTLLLVAPANALASAQPHALIPPGNVYRYELSFDKRNDYNASSPQEVLGAENYLGKERGALTADNCHLKLELVVGAALSEFRREVKGTGTLVVEELELGISATGELRAMQVQGEDYVHASLTGEIDTQQGRIPVNIGFVQSFRDKAYIPLRIGSYEHEEGMLSLNFGQSFNEMSEALTLESCWPDGRYITGETKPFVVQAFNPQGSPAEGATIYVYKSMGDGPITLFHSKTDESGQVTFNFDKGIIDLEEGPHNFRISAIAAQGQMMIWHWSEDEDFLLNDDTLLITATFGESSFQGGEFSFEHVPATTVPKAVLTCYPGKAVLMAHSNGETDEISLPLSPRLEEGCLLVPLKPLFEQLGYQVEWLAEHRTVLISGHEQLLRLIPSNPVVELNGQEILMGRPAVTQDGCTLVPLRQLAELLGYRVEWNEALRQVVVIAGQPDDVTYRNDQIGFSLVMPSSFVREVELRQEGSTLFFVYRPVQSLEPRWPYGVIGRVEIYDKTITTSENLQQNADMYGLRLIGENSKYYFGVAHATDLQIPLGSSEQLLAKFRALEADFDSVIRSFQVVKGS